MVNFTFYIPKLKAVLKNKYWHHYSLALSFFFILRMDVLNSWLCADLWSNIKLSLKCLWERCTQQDAPGSEHPPAQTSVSSMRSYHSCAFLFHSVWQWWERQLLQHDAMCRCWPPDRSPGQPPSCQHRWQHQQSLRHHVSNIGQPGALLCCSRKLCRRSTQYKYSKTPSALDLSDLLCYKFFAWGSKSEVKFETQDISLKYQFLMHTVQLHT